MSEPATQQDSSRPRWYRATPGRALVALLAVESLLFVSDWFRWSPWHKGCAVLTCVAVVSVALLLMALWYAVALIFRVRFQFSLRSLLLLTLGVTLPSSWLAAEVKAAERQKIAIAVITKSWGVVKYDYEFETDESVLFAQCEPRGAKWLRSLLGDDFFNDVWGANIQRDADIVNIKAFPHLRMLSFSRNPVGNRDITDLAVESLGSFPELVWLDVWGTQITDIGMEQVGRLTQLEYLDVHITRVTDIGLERLKGLRQLRQLELGGTKVTDQGIRHLQQALPNCEIVLE